MSKPNSQANVSGPEINCPKESRKFNHPEDRLGSTDKVAQFTDVECPDLMDQHALFQGYILHILEALDRLFD